VVSLSNLHRQVIFDTTDIGKPKVSAAAAKLRLMNPDTELREYQIRLTSNNCLDIIDEYDVVVDCTDNFSSRYMINDACVLKNKPVVYGAVSMFEGQVAVFNVSKEGKQNSGNYRDLFPEQPEQGEVMNCAEAGVLGVLPGIIGSMQASEVIKLITGTGEPLINQLLTYNTTDNRSFIFTYNQNQSVSKTPLNEKEFHEMMYDFECVNNQQFEIDAERFDVMLIQKNILFIDVREHHELPAVTEFQNVKIPLSELKQQMNALKEEQLVFFCQSGIRSLKAASMAAEYFGSSKRFYSLQSGIVSWKKLHKNQTI
jgi:adenylyltransferase/sulfurtransferase